MWCRLYCLLAQGQTDPADLQPVNPESVSFAMTREMMLILGVALALAAALIGWAFFVRKRRPTDPHLRAIEAGPVTDKNAPAEPRRHHRRHRRHRHHGSHSHRNPSLQETGGLPPLRPEEESPQA